VAATLSVPVVETIGAEKGIAPQGSDLDREKDDHDRLVPTKTRALVTSRRVKELVRAREVIIDLGTNDHDHGIDGKRHAKEGPALGTDDPGPVTNFLGLVTNGPGPVTKDLVRGTDAVGIIAVDDHDRVIGEISRAQGRDRNPGTGGVDPDLVRLAEVLRVERRASLSCPGKGVHPRRR
jgi:hypothetical protein